MQDNGLGNENSHTPVAVMKKLPMVDVWLFYNCFLGSLINCRLAKNSSSNGVMCHEKLVRPNNLQYQECAYAEKHSTISCQISIGKQHVTNGKLLMFDWKVLFDLLIGYHHQIYSSM